MFLLKKTFLFLVVIVVAGPAFAHKTSQTTIYKLNERAYGTVDVPVELSVPKDAAGPFP